MALSKEIENCTMKDKFSAKFKQFLVSVMNPNWIHTANEKTVDDLFTCALDLEEIFIQDKKGVLKETILANYFSLNSNRFLEVLLESIIKNQHLDEQLTLYAINKYTLLNCRENSSKFLEKLFSEVELRGHVYKLIEDSPDVDLDFFSINKFLCDVLNSSDFKSKIEYNLKSNTLTFLNALKHGEVLIAHTLMNEVINCLETQTDLKLWFMIMKNNNLNAVLDLCVIYRNFFNAILRFFDKFAEETESNYDEELNVQYSHVNLDFEDFIGIFQLFLRQENLKNVTAKYLDSKNLTDKNFCFWIDVKACL